MVEPASEDYLELIQQANAVFQKQFPLMVTYNVIGAPPTGTVAKTANDLVVWILALRSCRKRSRCSGSA